MKPLLLVAACSLAFLSACNRPEPEDATGADTGATTLATSEPTWTYESVRAEVVKLPDAFSDLILHHEHIPDFVAPMTGELHINRNGATGMRAMQMPFPPGEGVDISGLEVGDKIEVDLAVWGPETEGGYRYAMTAFRMLPDDAVLDVADKPSVAPPTPPTQPAAGEDDGG
ncbi:MAG: hypothetical protein ACF8Q5_03550 [Phycisphaerales bacterium JB040]